jgi:four helix bundle protein
LVICLYVGLPQKRLDVLGHQRLQSRTSVAARVREAFRAGNNSEFCAKLGVASQEADESLPWLELLNEDCQITCEVMDFPLHETTEVTAARATMVSGSPSH